MKLKYVLDAGRIHIRIHIPIPIPPGIIIVVLHKQLASMDVGRNPVRLLHGSYVHTFIHTASHQWRGSKKERKKSKDCTKASKNGREIDD